MDEAAKERFFIITAGRTGSTLLAALLAANGAEFAMPAAGDWDESQGGDYEHPDIVAAAACFKRAYDLSAVRPSGLPRWRWALYRHRAKIHLSRILRRARFVKAVNLDFAVQSAFTLGYLPKIIVSHRRFSAQALSLSQMYTHRTVEVLEADYLRTYRNALMQVHLYGGCLIDYEDLTDGRKDGWIAALATLTGVDPAGLAAARLPYLRRAAHRQLPRLSPQGDALSDEMKSLSDQIIPASPQALRNWQRRQGGIAPAVLVQ